MSTEQIKGLRAIFDAFEESDVDAIVAAAEIKDPALIRTCPGSG